MEDNLKNKLVQIIKSDRSFMDILRTVRQLELNDWYAGAGCVRGLVWDYLHSYNKPTQFKDVDIVYFDDSSIISEEEITDKLYLLSPTIGWEVVNQAMVHKWYQKRFGISVEPLTSSEEGILTWPETATCVGVRLNDNDDIEVCAPYGLEDLFNMVLRWNPKRVTKEMFYNRIKEKRLCEKWPKVVVADENDDI